MVHTLRPGLTALAILAAVAVLTAPPPAVAQTWTGTGGGPPNFDPVDWSNRFNWASAAVPVSGNNTALYFAGSAVSNNNLSGTFVLNYLEFDIPTTLLGNPLNFRRIRAAASPASSNKRSARSASTTT